MYKVAFTGYLAHDAKFFNAICKTCNKLENSTENVLCSKCGTPLQSLLDKREKPMSISECTVYPLRTDAEHKQLETSTKRRKNGMLPVHRFTLFSFTNKNGVLKPHPLHRYLAKGRRVFLEFNHEPVRSFFNSKDPDFPVQVEVKFVYVDNEDTIELQDQKKEISSPVPETQSTDTVVGKSKSEEVNPYANMTINELCSINPIGLDIVKLSMLNQAVLAKSVANAQQEKEQTASVGSISMEDEDPLSSLDEDLIIPEDDIPF